VERRGKAGSKGKGSNEMFSGIAVAGEREGPTTGEGSGKSIDDTPLERAEVCVAMVLSCKHANTVRGAEGKRGFREATGRLNATEFGKPKHKVSGPKPTNEMFR
jgi:hypothetical protein